MKKIVLSGVVGWDITATAVREELAKANGDDIEVHISSPGGLVGAGLEIFNLLRNYAGKKVCILSGYAMSMASYIPLANFDEIRAEDNAVYMIHNARGGVWGDHNDILNYGATLKGLSGLIARAYVKRLEKAGKAKSMEDICIAMDKESYYFGQGIVDEGFADVLIETENDDDSTTALAGAQAAFVETMAKMGREASMVREDLQKASAMLAMLDPSASPVVTPPASAGITEKEDQKMKRLADLLAENPAAKAEHDALVIAARAEGDTAGERRVQDRITAAAPFLNAKEYPTVGPIALKVIKGEENSATLTAVVAAVDAVTQNQASTAAQAATGTAPATPASPAPVIDPAAVVTDGAGLDAAIAQFREGR